MTYNVRVEPIENDYNYRNRLVITDASGERDHWDGGEPEDNSFNRDWSWVADELRNAYMQGVNERDQLLAEVARLREALEPFAVLDIDAFSHLQNKSDDREIYRMNESVIRLGDVRRARAAPSSGKE